MVRLFDAESDVALGEIGDEDLEFLQENLEEESSSDDDYYLTSETIDMLEEAGASETLLTLLRDALGDNDAVDIRWEQD